MNILNNDYTDRYFKWHLDNTKDYIYKTMNSFIEEYKPNSIIDFGCGLGFYLEVGLNNNILDLKGYELNKSIYTSKDIVDYIEYVDCSIDLNLTKKYDCVISIETAEHIETNNSDYLIKNISDSLSLNGILLFSAAQPGQGGTGHINCQPKTFWIEKLKNHHILYDVKLTEYILNKWREFNIPDYIINNLIVCYYQY